MARLPEAEIERLKREIAVEGLAEKRGVKLKRHGADLIGLCPFHEDRSPSLVISPAKNLWHCLGACQSGGSSIDWVMRAEGVSFRLAVEMLRKEIPSFVARTGGAGAPPPKKATVPKLEVIAPREAGEAELMDRVLSHYETSLRESPEALSYLAQRGIQNEEAITTFRLGYANRTLGYRLPQKNREEGAELRGRLAKLGLYRESGHEHFSGSLVIPILDRDGHVVEMYGRKITPNLRPGTPLHLYLPGPHRGVWNLSAVQTSEELVLCESLIDALTFWCAGIRNVSAAYGVEGFTQDHREAIRAAGTKRIFLAYDRDEAGDRAAEKLSRELAEEGIETLRVQFPKGMDANEYARKVTPASESMRLVVRQAIWMAKGKTRATLAPHPIVTAEAVTTSIEEVEQVTEEVLFPFAAVAAPEVERAPPSAPGTTTQASEIPLPAAADPSAVAALVFEESAGDELVARIGDRRWRIRGFQKNTSFQQMRVNVLVSRGGLTFVDSLDLYSARQRSAFVRQAVEEIGLDERAVKKDVGELLVALEAKQDTFLREKLAPKEPTKLLSEEEREAALALLRDPHLLARITEDFERAGVVGESQNLLVGYLAATSRKLEEPLAIVIQSSSAAGKSALMDAVLAMMPDEESVQYSAMTGQSLYYMGEQNLCHRVLAIVEEEGAERASYALKLLQSEGELTIASTGKDPVTGKLVTHAYKVEGPVAILLTTTAIEIDEELLNRCLVLTVDEGREQTRAIHARQRTGETLEGLLRRRERACVTVLHQNAQRLLRPIEVVNPYAEELRFVDTKTRTRRDHKKYLGLIRAVAFLHQHQRVVKEATTRDGEIVTYIEATREDVRVATELAEVVLGRGLDELPPQTRRLLGLVTSMVEERAKAEGVEPPHVRFTRREVREATSWGNTQLKVHLGRLVELEYVAVQRAARGEGHTYELRAGGIYDRTLVGVVGESREVVGPLAGGGRSALLKGNSRGAVGVVGANGTARPAGRDGATSYVKETPSFAAVAAAAAGAE